MPTDPLSRLLPALRRFNRRWLDRLAARPPEPHPPPEASPEAPVEARPARPRREVTVVAQATPNPHALKLRCSVEVGSRSFSSPAEAQADPIAKALFAVPGVRSVFAVQDFVTVLKDPTREWEELSPLLVDALTEALASGG
jgi:hypothetical protein